MEKALQGKTALVTGSTSGLGKEIAEALARAGCHVAIHGFGKAEEIAGFRAKLREAHGVQVFHHGADLTDREQIRSLMKTMEEELGTVDILVNNAGTQFVSPIEDFPDEKWDFLIALNLSAAFHMTKAVLPGMKKRGWGRIINIASAHGLVASPNKSAYIAAKHGLVGLTKATAQEVARDGITCNALCPGYIHTPLVEGQLDEQARASGISREKIIEDVLLTKHATRKFVEARQVASFVVLLSSEDGASTTGAAIPIDGGWTSA